MKDATVLSFYNGVARLADTSGTKISASEVYRVLGCARTLLQDLPLWKRCLFLMRWLMQ